MQTLVTSGAVIYAKDLGLVSKFYAVVADMAVVESEAGHVTLEAHGFQLVVVAIPPHMAETVSIESPPVRREATPIKLVFFVTSLDAASTQAAQLGGQMNLAERAWQFQGTTVLDGHDPEGNVFQLRQAGLSASPSG
jgi:predicted enzyme related to lactoylglutathione lyase